MAELTAKVESLEHTVRGFNGTVGLVGDVQTLKNDQSDMKDTLEMHRCEIYGTVTTTGLKADVGSLKEFKKDVTDFMTDIRGMFTKLVLAVIGTVIGGIIVQILLDYLTLKQASATPTP
jgi:hypothetical protein